MAKKPAPASIKHDGTTPEILAAAIVEIAEGTRKLLASPLERNTIVILIQESCKARKLTRTDIDAVLEAAATLDAKFLKKPKGAK